MICRVIIDRAHRNALDVAVRRELGIGQKGEKVCLIRAAPFEFLFHVNMPSSYRGMVSESDLLRK